MKPMSQPDGMPEIDPEIPENAVRLYGQSDAMDDFPVLKAFQQYIDAEQAKARKRMMILCIFFGALMMVVISVFLILLVNVSSRNQSLNDRLIEYAMKERERMASPIVVQPPQQQQDNSAIMALTAKIEEMQRKMNEGRAREDEARRQAEIEAAKPKGPTPEELEIKRLNALLAAEKEKLATEKARLAAERQKEKERQHQLEIEAYRRKHYPEFYEKKTAPEKPTPSASAHDELMQEIDKILEDGDAITYYDEEEEEPTMKASPRRTKKKAVKAPPKEYTIPVDVRGSSSRWSVPNE